MSFMRSCEHCELQEDEPDATKGKDTIPLRKYEAGSTSFS